VPPYTYNMHIKRYASYMITPFVIDTLTPLIFLFFFFEVLPINKRCSILHVRRVFFKSNKMTSFSAGYYQRKIPILTHLLEFLLLFHLFGNLNLAHPNTHSLKTLFLPLHLHLPIISRIPTKRMRKSTQNQPILSWHCYKN
jgi:hypothetical protein